MADKKNSIGEKIAYGATGIMEIIDIRVETVADVSREYYVLKDVSSRSDSQIYVPMDNEKLVSMMRPLISREEAERLIREADELPDIEWSRDCRKRMDKFREIMESGDHKKMISMIKTIYKAGKARNAEGKKNFLSDENAMHKAERLLYSELALALKITVEEVPDYIKNHI